MGVPPVVALWPRVARKTPPPMAKRTTIATAMIAGVIQDRRSDGPLAAGRRATGAFFPGGAFAGAGSETGAGMKVGSSELEAGVHAGAAAFSGARGAGVTGSKYEECERSASFSFLG